MYEDVSRKGLIDALKEFQDFENWLFEIKGISFQDYLVDIANGKWTKEID